MLVRCRHWHLACPSGDVRVIAAWRRCFRDALSQWGRGRSRLLVAFLGRKIRISPGRGASTGRATADQIGLCQSLDASWAFAEDLPADAVRRWRAFADVQWLPQRMVYTGEAPAKTIASALEAAVSRAASSSCGSMGGWSDNVSNGVGMWPTPGPTLRVAARPSLGPPRNRLPIHPSPRQDCRGRESG